MITRSLDQWGRSPVLAYALLSVAAVAATVVTAAVMSDDSDSPFDRFAAGLPPPLAVATVALLGAFALTVLAERSWSMGGPVGWLPLIAAGLFAVVAIAADLTVAFPEDTNVEWPTSIVFYPTIGFAAELVFHVIPVAAIAVATGWRFAQISAGGDAAGGTATHTATAATAVNDWRVWTIIVAVAAAEAAFQVAAALTDGTDRRLVVFVGVHLFAIGLVELTLFRRSGFAALLAFRMPYYLLWHIIWGHIRLGILF